jgi:FkbM family methyltransferase
MTQGAMTIMITNNELCSVKVSQPYKLPNGMSVYHSNKYETDFTYKEIFDLQIYARHGITLLPKSCIFDVGANIGLFTLFAKDICPSARILAFEPSPEICRLLRLNTVDLGESVQVYQCGISNEEKQTTYTYYPHYSIISGFHANLDQDTDRLAAGIRNQIVTSSKIDQADASRFVDHLMEGMLTDAQQMQCQMRTVSSLLRETGLDRIDLLKIDAEDSESEVLGGIDDFDWPGIAQVVMESHSKIQSDSVVAILSERGFNVTIEKEEQFTNSEITNIYARRS